ncbi:polysaccharide deacetylase family protein [Paenibacillus sp. D2_2]|uniref:polysaccharide deacetylase family protein n=1 Tax=Paenibacillus sp. D2_2 TaxID=3073092 RepID=UPI002815A60E|nr:polysaccharide deacetylase family protein [Paenibacillus sp. D2_2]WMT42977.1 polysaccharide deacetylase family protein [Paenibacillus sp. D2_2]
MSNSRNTKDSEIWKSRKSRNRRKRRIKPIVTIAVILASAAIILTVVVTKNLMNDDKAGSSATVVAPQLDSQKDNTSSGTEVVPNDDNNSDDKNKQPDQDKGTADQKDSDKDDTQADKDKNQTPSDKNNNDSQNQAPADKNNNDSQKPVQKEDQYKGKKVIYLTFDDGPGKYTSEIVKILNDNGIHATFFMVGGNLSGNEEAVKEASEAGNYIGMHSMTHDKKKLYDHGSAPFIKEFQKEQGLMEDILGTQQWLIRAPYGSAPMIDKKFRDDIVTSGFKMWDWTVDSLDWNYPKHPEKIIQQVKKQVHRDREVILMHERSQTVKVLPEVISYLKGKGYSFAVYKPDQHFSVNFAKDDRL